MAWCWPAALSSLSLPSSFYLSYNHPHSSSCSFHVDCLASMRLDSGTQWRTLQKKWVLGQRKGSSEKESSVQWIFLRSRRHRKTQRREYLTSDSVYTLARTLRKQALFTCVPAGRAGLKASLLKVISRVKLEWRFNSISLICFQTLCIPHDALFPSFAWKTSPRGRLTRRKSGYGAR